MSELHRTSYHNKTVNFLLFVFFPLCRFRIDQKASGTLLNLCLLPFFHFISSVTTFSALALRKDSLQRVSSDESPDQFTRSRLSDSLRPRRFKSPRGLGGGTRP